MSETSAGTGAAHNASVAAVNDIGALEAALAEAKAADEAKAPARRIDAAKRAVEKATQQLAWAKDALAAAQKESD